MSLPRYDECKFGAVFKLIPEVYVHKRFFQNSFKKSLELSEILMRVKLAMLGSTYCQDTAQGGNGTENSIWTPEQVYHVVTESVL